MRTSSSRRTSARINSASAPVLRISLTSFWPSSSRRPEIATRAPSFAKASAVARPIPVSAPVIKTTGVVISVLLEIYVCLTNDSRHLPRVDTHLVHPRDQGGPFNAQAGCGAVRAADSSLGLLQDSHDPVLFIEVIDSDWNQVPASNGRFGSRDR